MKKAAIALSILAAIIGVVAVGVHFDRGSSEEVNATSSTNPGRPSSTSDGTERRGIEGNSPTAVYRARGPANVQQPTRGMRRTQT